MRLLCRTEIIDLILQSLSKYIRVESACKYSFPEGLHLLQVAPAADGGTVQEILSSFVVLLFMNVLFICSLISQKANQPQSICLFTLLHFEVRDPKILFRPLKAMIGPIGQLGNQSCLSGQILVHYLKSIFWPNTKRSKVPLRLQVRWQQPSIIISSLY